MARDALNTWQQFLLDRNGRPAANGTVEFFTDSGRLTQKDIFADSDLTVAQTNPYPLDNEGRIQGDVKYQGTATLVLFDANGFEDKQIDEVLPTGSGDEDEIAKQRESVAAMIADQTLTAGNLVETAGYYAPNRYGGARYRIVAGGTGTPDNYEFINLGNGLQAQLLDLENNRDFLVAGARGDGGSDDTDAMQAVINQGGDIFVAGGFTFVGTNLVIPVNCTFYGGGRMRQRSGSAGDFIQCVDPAVTRVKFRDVTLSGNQPNTNSGNSTVGWVIPAA